MRYDIFDPDLRNKVKERAELIEGVDGQPYTLDEYLFELNVFRLTNGNYAFGVRFFNGDRSSITRLYDTRGEPINEAVAKVKNRSRCNHE